MSHFWLSKSTFVRSVKCQKALYLNKFHKELRDEITEEQQAKFSQGTNIGELAQQLFPGGIDVSPEEYYDFRPSIKQTSELLKQDNVIIYEAAFQHDGILCALDILVKKEGQIYAYEVKSSTSVKDTHVQDAGLQYYIMSQCGYQPKDISIVHINNQYIRQGDIDINKLFSSTSVLSDVQEFQKQVPELISQAKSTLQENSAPNTDIGSHCLNPYPCDFMGHCWDHIPEYSVFNISRLKSSKKYDLYNQGILELKDVPRDYPLNEKQRMQVDAEVNGRVTVNKESLTMFIDSLNYPLHFLDFETFQSALPLFDNSRPYQQIVFQYSMHIQESNKSDLKHKEFLAEGNGSDPREQFVDQLISDVKPGGDILVYNIGFERGRLQELQLAYPNRSDALQVIINRMVDLMIPFQQKHYYAPDLHGSYSIKKVLPSLVPDLSYSSLDIQNGGMAMNTFEAMMSGTFNGDHAQTRKALLDYCKMDTYAMVRILNKIEKLALED